MLQKGDLLFNRTNSRDLVGKTSVFLDKKVAIFAGYLVRFTLLGGNNPLFVNNIMQSSYYRSWCNANRSDAISQSNINATKLSNLIIPLPPLNEQTRIVQKIDSLMALCDQLEARRNERNAKRLETHASAIHHLIQSGNKDEFRTSWKFITDHFSQMYSVKENVEELKKAILTLAMQGKLVRQDPNDQRAFDLLNQINKSKNEFISKKIYRDNSSDEEDLSAKSDLPNGWASCNIRDLGFVLGGKRLPKGHCFSEEETDYRYLTVTNMKDATIVDNQIKWITAKTHDVISKYTISSNDIYITIAGTIGEVGEIPDDLDGMNLTENAAKIVFFHCDKKFLIQLFRSSLIQTKFDELVNKMAQPKLSLRSILGTQIFLPPPQRTNPYRPENRFAHEPLRFADRSD
jgi:type I restriction enzyme S subunit